MKDSSPMIDSCSCLPHIQEVTGSNPIRKADIILLPFSLFWLLQKYNNSFRKENRSSENIVRN